MAAEDFSRAVDLGLKLSKRLYYGKDRSVAPPRPMTVMEKSSLSYIPAAPMVYAVIHDPAIVDNPDIASYQPHVHGRCDPPALLPLQMNGITLDADCYVDTAFVTVTGSWRVHCVMGSRHCACRVAIPLGEQGSVLGLEVEAPRKSYSSQIIAMDDKMGMEKAIIAEDGGFLKPHIFTFTIPQVDGGSNLSIKVSWSQKLLYRDGQFSLSIPFSFPEYVTPAGKKMSKKEKIQLNVNSCPETEFLCKTTSHPLKELRKQAGKSGFLYESEVPTWSSSDFIFSYTVSSSNIYGGVLLQSPSVLDTDQRELFCFYLLSGNQQSRKVFKKEVVFVVDISGSMRGKPLEDTKKALSAALSTLDAEDLFSIIAFNEEIYIFSSSMELATNETIENAIQWMSKNFTAVGGTNILLPLNQATEMLTNAHNCLPIIFLITDGAVEDERRICDVMKSHLTNPGSMCLRIYTFGIGTFCNHYFLRMLAMLGRGYYDAAYDGDSIDIRIEGLFARASSAVLANIAIDALDNLDELEVYPSCIPDLVSKSPLIVSGRYRGNFPEIIKARGILPNMGNFVIDLKAQQAKDMPINKIVAKQQIDLLTAQAWFLENKELEEKITKMSIQSSLVSEYTRIILLENNGAKVATESAGVQEVHTKKDPQKMMENTGQKILMWRALGVGFGNLTATIENIAPGFGEVKMPERAEILAKAASNCCSRIFSCCCCPCCIGTCSRLNDQCAVVMAQCCTALACLGCFSCFDLCCDGRN